MTRFPRTKEPALLEERMRDAALAQRLGHVGSLNRAAREHEDLTQRNALGRSVAILRSQCTAVNVSNLLRNRRRKGSTYEWKAQLRHAQEVLYHQRWNLCARLIDELERGLATENRALAFGCTREERRLICRRKNKAMHRIKQRCRGAIALAQPHTLGALRF